MSARTETTTSGRRAALGTESRRGRQLAGVAAVLLAGVGLAVLFLFLTISTASADTGPTEPDGASNEQRDSTGAEQVGTTTDLPVEDGGDGDQTAATTETTATDSTTSGDSDVSSVVAEDPGADTGATSSTGRPDEGEGKASPDQGDAGHQGGLVRGLVATIDRAPTAVTSVVDTVVDTVVETATVSTGDNALTHVLQDIPSLTSGATSIVEGVSTPLVHGVGLVVAAPTAPHVASAPDDGPDEAAPVDEVPAASVTGHPDPAIAPVAAMTWSTDAPSTPVSHRGTSRTAASSPRSPTTPAADHAPGVHAPTATLTTFTAASQHDAAVPAGVPEDGADAPTGPGSSGQAGGGVAATLPSSLLPSGLGLWETAADSTTLPGGPSYDPGHSPG